MLRTAKPNRLYMAIAPTYPMMRDSTLRTFLAVARTLNYLRCPFAKGDMVATLGNGAEILFRSCDDPERLRGPNLSGVWLDEASLMDRGVFDISIGRLREDGEHGRLDATFTPKGKRHWTYEIFGTGKPDTALFRARTKQNPFLPPTFEPKLQTMYAGLRAQQELGGEFLDIEGAEWPTEYFEDQPGKPFWFENWPDRKHIAFWAMSLDPSKGRDARAGDYRAYVWGALDFDGVLWVDADLAREPTTALVETGFELYRKLVTLAGDDPAAVAGFGIETNTWQELLATEFLRVSQQRQIVLPMHGFNNYVNKAVRLRRLGPWLAQRRIRFKANSVGTRMLVDQLMAFGEDSKEHDDGPDALEMLCRLVTHIVTGGSGGDEPGLVRG